MLKSVLLILLYLENMRLMLISIFQINWGHKYGMLMVIFRKIFISVTKQRSVPNFFKLWLAVLPNIALLLKYFVGTRQFIVEMLFLTNFEAHKNYEDCDCFIYLLEHTHCEKYVFVAYAYTKSSYAQNIMQCTQVVGYCLFSSQTTCLV